MPYRSSPPCVVALRLLILATCCCCGLVRMLCCRSSSELCGTSPSPLSVEARALFTRRSARPIQFGAEVCTMRSMRLAMLKQMGRVFEEWCWLVLESMILVR